MGLFTSFPFPLSMDSAAQFGSLLKDADVVFYLGTRQYLLTRRLNSQLRHAGLDPASSTLLDSRLRGNDELRVFIRRSNISGGLPAMRV
jgi:hypothetical protein